MTDKQVLSESLLDAQVSVLGAMILDGDLVGQILCRVGEKDFTYPQYRSIFSAIRSLYADGKPVDSTMVNGKLGGGFTDILISIMDRTPTAANWEAYVELLKESATVHHMQEIGLQLSTAPSGEECSKLLDQANRMLVRRTGIHATGMKEAYERFLDRHDGEKKAEYLSWGMAAIDGRVFAEAGDMVILGGYPSDGKTAMALSMAVHIARKKRVCYFLYEGSNDKLYDRIVAAQTLLSFSRIKKNELTEEDYRTYDSMRSALEEPHLDLVEASGMSVVDLQAYSMANHYDVVFIDYLQKIKPARRNASLFEQVSEISSDLQQFGRTHGITVVALSQLSRPEKTKSGNTSAPTMSSLRQSGQMEQDADVIFLLYRESYGEPNSLRVLKVAKNKDGESNVAIRLRFDGDTQTFSRLSDHVEAQPSRPRPNQPSLFDKAIRALDPNSDPDNPF